MLKPTLSVGICLAFSLLFIPPTTAEINLESLQIKIDRLEKELDELKQLMRQMKMSTETGQTSPDIEKKHTETVAQGTGSMVASTPAVRDFQFDPYGYIKLDASYDDSRTNYGNFILFVPNESGHKNDDEFNMTARQTRIGLKIMAPEYHDWSAMAKVEIDFYGDGTKHENKAEPLLRHAFIEAKKGNTTILAGQTSDLISPLNPSTLNYIVGWSAGNIGYRRPQLRLTHYFPLDDRKTLITALTIARTAGLVNEDLDLDLQNDGEDAGFPTVQARLGLMTYLLTNKKSTFGISGHFGREEIESAELYPGTSEKKIESWSVNGDFDLPLSNCLTVNGEVFFGRNLDDYFGGILQGINASTGDPIRSIGGWGQAAYRLNNKWLYNLGFGIDDPSNSDLSPGMRSRNMFFYINANYSLILPLTIALEYSHWETQYEEMSTGIDNRLQSSFIYSW